MNLKDSIAEFDTRLRQGVERLAASRFLLIATLLLVDALLHPYRGISHDSRLYAYSAANLLRDGALAGDLYLRFGSQGEYTILTWVAERLAGTVGIDWSFFLLYILSRVVVLFSLAAIVDKFLDAPALKVSALLLMTSARMPFGGFELLTVQESFLTPRPFAYALSLLAISSALSPCRGLLRAALFLLCAFLVHPLIPSGALLGVLVIAAARGRNVLIVPIAGALLALACIGLTLLVMTGIVNIETLDPAWRAVVVARSPFYFPSEWPLVDWLRVVFSIACIVAAAMVFDKTRRHHLFALVAAGVTGLLLALAAERLPLAFLVQAQPYRSLWLISILVVPCAVSWFSETLRNEERTVVAGALFALSLLACDSALCSGPTMLVIFVPLVLWSLRKPAEAGLPRVYFRMLGVGFAVFIFLTLLFEVGGTNDILAEILRQFKLTLFAFVLLPLLLVALGGKRFLASALPVFTSLALVIQTLGFLAATTYSYPPSKRRKNELVEKLRGELPRFTKGSSPLTIYWPGMLDEIWFHLEQLSYFNSFQCAGVVFKRETALEAARRAQLVAPFERYYYAESRQLRYGGSFNAIPRMALGMFPDTGERGEPAFADLKKLCLDPVLDLVLLDYLPFGQRGDFIRLDDRLYLFACQNFRDSPDGDKTNSQL